VIFRKSVIVVFGALLIVLSFWGLDILLSPYLSDELESSKSILFVISFVIVAIALFTIGLALGRYGRRGLHGRYIVRLLLIEAIIITCFLGAFCFDLWAPGDTGYYCVKGGSETSRSKPNNAKPIIGDFIHYGSFGYLHKDTFLIKTEDYPGFVGAEDFYDVSNEVRYLSLAFTVCLTVIAIWLCVGKWRSLILLKKKMAILENHI